MIVDARVVGRVIGEKLEFLAGRNLADFVAAKGHPAVIPIGVGVAARTGQEMQTPLPEPADVRPLRHLRVNAAGGAAVAGCDHPDAGEVGAHYPHHGLGDELKLLLDGIRVQQEFLQYVDLAEPPLAGPHRFLGPLALRDVLNKAVP